MQGMWVRSLRPEDPLEEEMTTDSNILGWRIPWTEDPVGYSLWGGQRVRHNQWLSTNIHLPLWALCPREG